MTASVRTTRPSTHSSTGPTGRLPSARRVRLTARAVHLGAAALLGVLIYGPPALAEPLLDWTRLVIVPVLGLTGLLLWKQAKLRTAWRSLRRLTGSR